MHVLLKLILARNFLTAEVHVKKEFIHRLEEEARAEAMVNSSGYTLLPSSLTDRPLAGQRH